jgi:fatty-acyl-CoA synthase
MDRRGDTYRWKSENVSTMEVCDAPSSFEAAQLINIYGVAVPDHEGRAGKAAIQLKPEHTFDGRIFFKEASESLPHYAMPLFVKITESSDLTATFKLRKVDLQKQGYDPQSCKDELFVLDTRQETYVKYSIQALENLSIKPFSVTA